jgi:peptide/nickel transport system permease protein
VAGGAAGGSVVVEVIFAIPGMGRLMYEAVLDKDVPLLQAGLVCIVGLAVLINTVTDLLYLAINPALRTGHVGR